MDKKDLFFMMDQSNSDNKESIIDFMLSWTLRMASVSDDGYKNTVQRYCTKILSKIVFDDVDKIDNSYKSIESVKTWKQWKRIDLLAEIVLIDNGGQLSNHVLVIEDKAYTSLHGDQLNRYKQIVEDEYKGTEFEGNIHYVYFTIKERYQIEDDEILCKEADFQPFAMEEIRDCIWPLPEDLILTGNELFDEFWIKNWG